MSYEQAIKHAHNHRKDRFYQQCSGPVHATDKKVYTDPDLMIRVSFQRIKDAAKCGKIQFPFRLEMFGPWYDTTARALNIPNDPAVISSMDELERFEKDYIE